MIPYIVIIFVSCRPTAFRFLLFRPTDGPKIQQVPDHKRVDLDFSGENQRKREDDSVGIGGIARGTATLWAQWTRAAQVGAPIE